MGNSRGVGFARWVFGAHRKSRKCLCSLTMSRFDSRDICDEIIRKFNGVGIGEEGLPMNIRYADTPAQKELKRVTAERRQFRTNEYNIGAYGTPLVGLSPALYNQQAHWRRNLPQSRRFVSAASGAIGCVVADVEITAACPPRRWTRAALREARCLVHSLRMVIPKAFLRSSNSCSRAATSADATISTPTTSECDESVTIRADPAVVATVGKENFQPSPTVKKEVSKKESQ